jgi:uncharacterized membrane protein
MGNLTETRPLGQLFSELAQETATLVRHEVDLAKVEMAEKARTASRDAAQIAVGGAIAIVGSLALVAAVILALATVISPWAAALIVGLAVSALGVSLVVIGLTSFKRLDPAPRLTLQTLREDKQWLREQVSR